MNYTVLYCDQNLSFYLVSGCFATPFDTVVFPVMGEGGG
jgi:hypothetical protein